MKCYICLTDSVVGRKDYFDMLEVALISARKNTTLTMVCLYDGEVNDPVYRLLEKFDVEIILHKLPYEKELMEIYPKEWMIKEIGKEIPYNRIFGTFMRMEIPIIEKQDQYVLYADIDVLFTGDIMLDNLPKPKYLAAAGEFEIDPNKIKHFNAGILLLNIEGMKVKYEQFVDMMKRRERTSAGLFDQGYLNQLCFKEMEILPVEYNWKPYWGINDNAKLIHFHGMKPSSNLSEAGFTTDDNFFRDVFDANEKGYAGYVYYFSMFFDYLGRKDDKWLYEHLQYILNLYKNNSFAHIYKIKYKKYQRLFNVTLIICGLLFILLCLSIFFR